ncbi:hypothetical protein GBA52_014532 [Prunus armeniaca]|nr:hypothetical protein GBA52_014532 [Prunus armeniaca]
MAQILKESEPMITYLCLIDGGSSSSIDDGGSSSSTDDGESSSSRRLVCVKGLQALEEEERRLVSSVRHSQT